MDTYKILIVEDEQRLAEILKRQLDDSGFSAEITNDGYSGKKLVEEKHFDLVILDINLPLLNGYELCREIRKTNSKLPIIMLTALGTPDNKLSGFEAGADDYILKPFDFRELLARMNVFLRRREDKPVNEILKLADLEMNLKTKTVTRSNKRIDLTSKEFLLLQLFLQNPDKLLSRDLIIEKVWGIDFDPSTNIIDVYINYLRKKIDKDFSKKLIYTKFGFGFYASEKEI